MRIWRCHKRRIADAAGEATLLCEKVGNDEQLVVEHIAAVNQTTLGSDLEAGIKNGETYWPTYQQLAVAAGGIYERRWIQRLNSYERVYLRATGATANDVIELWAYGIIVMPGESYTTPGQWTGR